METYDSLKKYIDYTWHTEYPKERETLHAKIINNHFVDKQRNSNPLIIFTGGCYGAGKGHTMRYLHSIGKINLSEWVYADPDTIRAKYNCDDFKEAGYIVEMIEYYALENNYNIIIDGSLKDYNWYIPHFKMIKETFTDYEIIAIFVVADLDTILERNKKRCIETSRCIPESSIVNTFNSINDAYKEYSKFLSRCYLVRNNTNQHDENFFNDIGLIVIN